MGPYLRNGLGDEIDAPSIEDLRRFLCELDPNDKEHGAAWVSTRDGITLEWNVGGRMAFARRGTPTRHMLGVEKERAVELWLDLMADRLDEIEACPWLPGVGPLLTAAEKAELVELQRTGERAFYDSLGEERKDAPCRRAGCTRGSVAHSVLCRPHHFESVRGRRSPFED